MPIQSGKYVAPTWNNNAPPPVNASELQAVCDTLETCQNSIEQITNNGAYRPGSFMWWTQATAPDGWLICDGSQVSRTTYSDLFSVIGTTFGSGDGSTTFTLPDMRATFVRGAGSKNGYSAVFGQIQDATNFSYGTSGYPVFTNFGNADKIESVVPQNIDGNPQSQRSGGAVYIRPYNIALTPIIKY